MIKRYGNRKSIVQMKTIVFYDKMADIETEVRAGFEMAHDNEDIAYIGLDRDLVDKRGLHYLDFISRNSKSNFSTVFFLDLAPRGEDEAKISRGCFNMVIIDHHKLKYDPVYRAGVSMLTWENFFKGEEAPNDRDVWLNKMQPQLQDVISQARNIK